MRLAHDVETVRAAEEVLLAALPEGALMDRAATGLARTCALLLEGVYGSRVVLLVGSGNNGGDALYAGAALARRGARVDAVLLSERAHEGGLTALRAAGGRVAGGGVEDLLEAADLVVDGILGIGGRGGLRPEAAALVARAEASVATLVAVDVPSGVDAGTGEVAGAAVHADVTVTFGTLKPGLVVDPGASHAGVVELVDIGLGPHLLAHGAPALGLLDPDEVAALLPAPGAESDKYRRGVLGVVAGSDAYTGAAVLTVGGALRAGAGMVRYSGPDVPTGLVRARWPEVVVGEGRVQAWAAGPGLGTDDAARARLEKVLLADEPAVVDADGTTVLAALVRERGPLASWTSRPVPLVLTPHAGELARLLDAAGSDAGRGEVEAARLACAREAAARYGAVVLLKGSTTVVAAPDGSVLVNDVATPWLATAGSGDVLTGVVGALLAGGVDPLDAAAAGAHLHGLAGRLAAHDEDGTGVDGAPVTAEDVLAALPAARRALRAG
ncbi:MAG TPA: NAD(P)H-hydrate dehydratase [Motilibacteraceae bacterium]|nr:NAD(P)H-hydrate dehydratase [Motilibacteraceae bacterium]